MKKRLFQIFVVIAVNLGIILGVFLIAEAVLRIFDLPFHGSYYPIIYKDSHIRKHIPNEPYEYKKEGYSKGRFNSQGYLDYERSLIKPDDVFRIAVVGDSITEGLQVPLEKTFCRLVEKELNKRYDQEFEVMNFGVAGYATGDEYILLKEEIMDYAPDMVVLVFFSINDVVGNYSRLDQVKRRFYFDIDEHGNLVLDESYYNKYLNSLEGRIRILLDGRSRIFRGLLALYRDLVVYKDQDVAVGSAETPSLLFNDELSDDYKFAWKITEELLFEIKRYVESRNARFLLVSIPHGVQFLALEEWSRLRPRSSRDRPEQILRQISNRKRIDYLDLLPLFLTNNKEFNETPYFQLSGHYAHLNEIGHKWTSKALCRYIYESQD